MLFGLVSRLPESSSAARVASDILSFCWLALIMKSAKLSAIQKTMKRRTPTSTRFQLMRRYQGSPGGS